MLHSLCLWENPIKASFPHQLPSRGSILLLQPQILWVPLAGLRVCHVHCALFIVLSPESSVHKYTYDTRGLDIIHLKGSTSSQRSFALKQASPPQQNCWQYTSPCLSSRDLQSYVMVKIIKLFALLPILIFWVFTSLLLYFIHDYTGNFQVQQIILLTTEILLLPPWSLQLGVSFFTTLTTFTFFMMATCSFGYDPTHRSMAVYF